MDGRRIRTKDEFLCWSQHVERECDFVLVVFLLEPFYEGVRLEH